MNKIILKNWESNDFMLDENLIFNNIKFSFMNEVKLYMLTENKNHKFLNKLWDTSKLSDTDYDCLIRWYYDKKTYIDTPAKIKEDVAFIEQRKIEELEKYQNTLELMKK